MKNRTMDEETIWLRGDKVDNEDEETIWLRGDKVDNEGHLVQAKFLLIFEWTVFSKCKEEKYRLIFRIFYIFVSN